MLVVGDVYDPIELLIAIKATVVDLVIITPVRVDGLPKICKRLLDERPLLKILVLPDSWQVAILYQKKLPRQLIDNPSEQIIFDAIRKSLL